MKINVYIDTATKGEESYKHWGQSTYMWVAHFDGKAVHCRAKLFRMSREGTNKILCRGIIDIILSLEDYFNDIDALEIFTDNKMIVEYINSLGPKRGELGFYHEKIEVLIESAPTKIKLTWLSRTDPRIKCVDLIAKRVRDFKELDDTLAKALAVVKRASIPK
ncbi:MAG: hypothetical protein WC880_05140 [Candidatus Paceibacterota bacterium]